MDTLSFAPFIFALNLVGQALMYLLLDYGNKFFCKFGFYRETFTGPDGATFGVDWTFDKKSDKDGRPKDEDNRPILLLLPGLGGQNFNLYTVAIKKLATQRGFKTGTVLFRNSEGLPVTSGKFCYSACW